MTIRIPAAIAATLLGSILAAPAPAFNLFSLEHLPVRYMTEEDRDILHAAARNALDRQADGETAHWENPKTGAHGDLMPRATFERSGQSCRDLEVANSAGGRDNRLVLTLCKQSDGEWRIESR